MDQRLSDGYGKELTNAHNVSKLKKAALTTKEIGAEGEGCVKNDP